MDHDLCVILSHILSHLHPLVGFHERGYPQWMVYRENPIKLDDWGVLYPYFRKPPFTYMHILILFTCASQACDLLDISSSFGLPNPKKRWQAAIGLQQISTDEVYGAVWCLPHQRNSTQYCTIMEKGMNLSIPNSCLFKESLIAFKCLALSFSRRLIWLWLNISQVLARNTTKLLSIIYDDIWVAGKIYV